MSDHSTPDGNRYLGVLSGMLFGPAIGTSICGFTDNLGMEVAMRMSLGKCAGGAVRLPSKQSAR